MKTTIKINSLNYVSKMETCIIGDLHIDAEGSEKEVIAIYEAIPTLFGNVDKKEGENDKNVSKKTTPPLTTPFDC